MTDLFEGGIDALADEFYEAENRRAEVALAVVQLLEEANGDMVIALRNALIHNHNQGRTAVIGSLFAQQVDGQGGGPAEITGA